ncbi:MmgE/PrpD family protein [Actinomadura welshii]|uniref:MmgE/PrpD family protein n=1 Tax=Actinomadura welshii TaxID=3103817 RepID=UPI0003AD625C|nr:MmgE/PrpD family protein [Actinomadura madurae]
MDDRHVCARLAERLAAPSLPQAGPATRRRLRELVLDSIGCGLGAAGIGWGRSLVDGTVALDGPGGPATVFGSATRVGTLAAASANALLANCLDFDDTLHGHPGAVIVPTALAVGDARRSSGADVLAAVLAGYEVAGRLGTAARPSTRHRLASWGTGGHLALAGAAVTARLLHLDETATAHALALAACAAPVPSVRQSVYGPLGPSMAKNNYAAAATAGMTAAYQADHHMTGPLDVLDDDRGFARLVATDQWDPRALLDGWSTRFQADQVATKPYSCCRKIHASLDAVLAARDEHRLDASEIIAIDLHSGAWATSPHFARPDPADAPAAQFSAPYCVAAALRGHQPGPAWFHPGTLTDTAVRRLAEKVRLLAPAAPSSTVLTLRSTRGTFHSEVRHPKGHPLNPMTDAEIESKFRRLAGPVLGAERATAISKAVRALQDTQDVGTLTALLRP